MLYLHKAKPINSARILYYTDNLRAKQTKLLQTCNLFLINLVSLIWFKEHMDRDLKKKNLKPAKPSPLTVTFGINLDMVCFSASNHTIIKL